MIWKSMILIGMIKQNRCCCLRLYINCLASGTLHKLGEILVFRTSIQRYELGGSNLSWITNSLPINGSFFCIVNYCLAVDLKFRRGVFYDSQVYHIIKRLLNMLSYIEIEAGTSPAWPLMTLLILLVKLIRFRNSLWNKIFIEDSRLFLKCSHYPWRCLKWYDFLLLIVLLYLVVVY